MGTSQQTNGNKNMVTLSSIFAKVHKGTCFIGFDTVTIPVLTGGKSNPMQGRIKKVMTGAIAMVNSNYENGRNKQLETAGFAPTFKIQPRKWGIKPLAGMPIITHKDAVYLNTSILQAGKVSYLLDDAPINSADIVGLKESTGTGIAENEAMKQLDNMTSNERENIAVNAGIMAEAMENPNSILVDADILEALKNNTRELYPRDFKAESITALRVNSLEYTNIDAVNA